MEHQIFVCDCSSAEHQIILSRIEGDEEVYFRIHLTMRSFWARVLQAVRHVFGRRCKYGDFDEVVLSKEVAARLANALAKPL